MRGRRAQTPEPPAQARLVPLADGHAARPVAPAATAPQQPATPFTEHAPEATFSLAQLREPAAAKPARTPMRDIAQQVRTSPPSFREIRAAAASRTPVARVTIPLAEVEGATLTSSLSSAQVAPAQPVLPGMDDLVERVRQRTAARLSRFSVTA